MRKIKIDRYSYISWEKDGKFTLHTSVSGPTGAEVYYFERGFIRAKQRRSYAGCSPLIDVKWQDSL